jgi:hypothetical protein
MVKINLELSKKLPKHIQDDKKYIKNMFLKEKQKSY